MSAYLTLTVFLAGVLCAAYSVAALFFLRFWQRSRDRFFGAFSIAFWLMAANQAVAAFAPAGRGESSRAYLLRLLAFLLIIWAVLDKNAPGAPKAK